MAELYTYMYCTPLLPIEEAAESIRCLVQPTEVVVLGDFCDNGPSVLDLLKWQSTEQWKVEFPSISLRGIFENHVSV